jgi:hypothetical protein
MLIFLIATVWSAAFLMATAICRSAACADRASSSVEGRVGGQSGAVQSER